MEFKKKTIIWEDNNEPPKNYIGAKKDGKFYEYSYTVRGWVESKSISGESEGSDSGGENEDIKVDYGIYPIPYKIFNQSIGTYTDEDIWQKWIPFETFMSLVEEVRNGTSNYTVRTNGQSYISYNLDDADKLNDNTAYGLQVDDIGTISYLSFIYTNLSWINDSASGGLIVDAG